MKFLISNYSSSESTEPLYFNTALNLADCKSTLWPNNISAYDMFDIVKPDIHLTHHKVLTTDVILYLKENPGIDLIINITHLNQNGVIELEKALKDHGITPALFFNNQYDHGLKCKTNIVNISHGADIFLGGSDSQYNIDYAIFIDDPKLMCPIGETYHYISTNPELQNKVDFFAPINGLSSGYRNYNHVVIRYFHKIIPQLFFDAAFYGGSVFFDISDRTSLDIYLRNILGEGEHCNLNNMESGKIRDKIIKKHTCLHKTKSLLSQLPCKDQTNKLQSIIESSIK